MLKHHFHSLAKEKKQIRIIINIKHEQHIHAHTQWQSHKKRDPFKAL